MANNTLLDNLQLFFDTSACLLICTIETCKFALSNGPSRVTTHLRDKHNISTEARKGLNQLLKSLSPAPLKPDDASPRADGSAEHDKVRVYEGFFSYGNVGVRDHGLFREQKFINTTQK
ncbi:hypothetical protein HZ326_25719 [Fusarium oxysporum f. sp. albedinis]|nr:hypothetical protein HZ326_25719 [Fusarium oxysporum f. sp. albedinis]